jgi:hypothetical protein
MMMVLVEDVMTYRYPASHAFLMLISSSYIRLHMLGRQVSFIEIRL